MAAYIALFISLVSLILMIVILIRFKKLFSADSIIEKTKAQMNRVIKDVNSNATRDIELINESSRRLRALLNEGDIKMEHFREASQLLRDTIAEAEKQTAGKSRKTSNATKDFIDPEASFSLVKGGPSRQGSLFDEPETKEVSPDEAYQTGFQKGIEICNQAWVKVLLENGFGIEKKILDSFVSDVNDYISQKRKE